MPIGAMKTPHKAMKTAEKSEKPLKKVLLVIVVHVKTELPVLLARTEVPNRDPRKLV